MRTAEEWGAIGSRWVIRSTKDRRGKYGRMMADVLAVSGEESLCSLLLRERLAVSYQGENKSDLRPAHEANWDWLEGKACADGPTC